MGYSLDVLKELEEKLIDWSDPTPIVFDSSYYNVLDSVGDDKEYGLYAFAKPNYNDPDGQNVWVGACGFILTGSDDPNSPMNTWVKGQLSGMYDSIQPYKKGVMFFSKRSEVRIQPDDAKHMLDRIIRYVDSTLMQDGYTLMRKISAGVAAGMVETVKSQKRTPRKTNVKLNKFLF